MFRNQSGEWSRDRRKRPESRQEVWWKGGDLNLWQCNMDQRWAWFSVKSEEYSLTEVLELEDQDINMMIYTNNDVAQGVRQTKGKKNRLWVLISNMLWDIRKVLTVKDARGCRRAMTNSKPVSCCWRQGLGTEDCAWRLRQPSHSYLR